VTLTAIPANSINTYSASDIASAAGITGNSFSAEITVTGRADKIFAIVCQNAGNGRRIIPVYKNESSTNSTYCYY